MSSGDAETRTESPSPQFESRDPGDRAFWNERFAAAFMPWDFAGVPEDFVRYASSRPACPVLIPGCGRAHEAHWLAEAGWQVRAVDFAAEAVVAARQQLGACAGVVEQADFFSYQPPFQPQWIYERTFQCALPLARRADYARRMAELLPVGGTLAGFFLIGPTRGGPPFSIERADLDAMLTPNFECLEERASADAMAVFEGRERWMVWRRH
jgi:hypothetical protein